MASFSMNITNCSRSGGQSAGAKFDYVMREGKYSADAVEVVASGYGHMPEWAAENPRVLFVAADDHERKNASLCKEVRFALPREFSHEQRVAAAEAHARKLSGPERLPYVWALHAGRDADGNDHNPHVHIVLCERGLDGFDRTPETWFKRYNAADPAAGGARKCSRLKDKEVYAELRAWSAEYQNDLLAAGGHEDRVDHRSYAERDILRLPQPHLGPYSHRALQEGRTTVRTERHKHIGVLNRDLIERARTGAETVPGHEVDRSREILYGLADDDKVKLPDGDTLRPAWAGLIERHRATVAYLSSVWSEQWLRFDHLGTPLREVKLALVSAAERLGTYIQLPREGPDTYIPSSRDIPLLAPLNKRVPKEPEEREAEADRVEPPQEPEQWPRIRPQDRPPTDW